MKSSILYLPGDYGFSETLQSTFLPEHVGALTVIDPVTGIATAWQLGSKELDDYLYGGQYDEELGQASGTNNP